MTISDAFMCYAADVIAFKGQAAKTEENHLICMRNLISYFGDIDMRALTFQRIRDWKLDLDKSRLPATVRNYVIKLRVVLTYLRDKGEDVTNPELIPVPKRGDTIPEFIYAQEVSRLLEACDVPRSIHINRIRNKALISLLFASGIRIGECIQLNRDSIRDKSFTIMGKGNKARLCFIDERTDELIRQYLSLRTDNCKALFISNQTCERITTGTIQEIFKSVRKRSGIQNVHPHTMRHSFATNLLMSNTNMRYVQELLGHASLETTQMYTHVVNEDLRAVYDLHHTI